MCEGIPEEYKSKIREWAIQRSFIRRIYFFGSRVKGVHRPDSDLDVAIEFDPVDTDEDCLTTWTSDAQEWQNQLEPLTPYKLHLEWHDPGGGTPTISSGLVDSSILIYERADLTGAPNTGPQADG